MRKLFAIVRLLALGLSWVVLGLGNPARAGARDEELAILRTILPESLLGVAKLELASRESFRIQEESGASHLGLRVFPGQPKVNGGIRAEVSIDYPFVPGDTVRYSWRFQVPQDFVSDAPANRWWVIGQWHDQPDASKGETWDGFKSSSPPVLLGLGELEGKLGMVLTYGPTNDPAQKTQTAGPLFLERGRWHQIAVVIRWSRGADGKADVYLDDAPKPSVSLQGPNMNNSFQHFWKAGMYRHPGISTNNWIYLDDLNAAKELAR
jgi:hypothetical protein